MKKNFLLLSLLSIFIFQLSAQLRPVQINKPKHDSVLRINNQIAAEKINRAGSFKNFKIKKSNTAIDVFKNVWQQKITLLTGAYLQPDFDNKNSPYIFSGSTNLSYENLSGWEADFLWKNISRAAAYARYEISELPFPISDDPNFKGVLMSGIVEHKNRDDSMAFHIRFINPNNNNTNTPYGGIKLSRTIGTKLLPVPVTNAVNDGVYDKAATAIRSGTKTTSNTVVEDGSTKFFVANKAIMSAVADIGKYYIRITPYNINAQVIDGPSNIVQLIYKPAYFKTPEPTPSQLLRDDYTVTGFNYVPAHFEEAGYMACVVVSGYDEAAVNSNSFLQSFKNAYPIGKIICPEPPQDKPWYEKALSGVTGVVGKTVSGAMDIANDCKSYVNTIVDVTLTPIDALKNWSVGEVLDLKQKILASVDASLDAAGLNPQLSNYDEMLLKANAQIMMTVNQVVNETVNIPLDVKNKLLQNLQQGFDDMVKQSAQKNFVNGGFLHFKPDPRGQFQNPYIEVEITRTGKKYTGKPLLAGTTVYQGSNKIITDWSAAKKSNYTKVISASVFQDASISIPYLANMGDKIKLLIVLCPRILYLHHNKIGYEKNEITSVDESSYEYESEWHDTNYAGLPGRYSPGFQLMYFNSENSFGVNGIKIAPGVKTKWVNPVQ